MKRLLVLLCIFHSLIFCEEASEEINIHQFTSEPLFISLGSWCNVAINLRDYGLRKAAFPFDWIASVDGEKFLELIKGDFEHFLDEDYLFVKDGHFFNDYYRIELPHDYCANSEEMECWVSLNEKYQRRIKRFQELENYRGKVYFIRSSFGYSNHPDRYYKSNDTVSISDSYAYRLYDVLRNRFPYLDFTLIICDNNKPNKKLTKNIYRLQDVPTMTSLQIFERRN